MKIESALPPSPEPFQPNGRWIHFTPPWESGSATRSEAGAAPFDKTAAIVIADDDPVSREIVSAAMKKWGFRTIVTRDGHEAMAAIRAEQGPMVAILDWMMPGMDGLEVCRRVRQIGKPVYIILLTVRAAKESLVEGIESGADDYLVKPFDKNELLARVHAGMRIINLQDALSNHVKELEEALLEVKNLRGQLAVPL
jgi:sigma-B regulation protein RsbU (phosphoserine phosphatase)